MVYPLLQCVLSDGIISQLVPRSPRHSPPLLRGSRREGRTEVARQPLSAVHALFCLVVSSNHLTSSLYISVIGQHLLESLISRWIWGLFMLGYEMTPFEFPTPHPKASLNGSNAYRSYRSQLYTPSLFGAPSTPSHPRGHHTSTVRDTGELCTIRQLPTGSLPPTRQCVNVHATLWVCPTPSFPADIHSFFSTSVSALQGGSSVPFF